MVDVPYSYPIRPDLCGTVVNVRRGMVVLSFFVAWLFFQRDVLILILYGNKIRFVVLLTPDLDASPYNGEASVALLAQ